MKQTAVEWIEDKIQSDMTFIEILGLIRQAKEMHKQEIEQHAINFNLFVENDEVTDQKVEIIQNLYKDYLKEFYNETFWGKDIIWQTKEKCKPLDWLILENNI